MSEILNLARCVHDSRNPYKGMAMLKAAFDESGTHDGAAVVSISGFVGRLDEWEPLETRCQDILGEFGHLGVSWFHMKECLSQTDQFGRVDKPGCRYIITQISKAIENSGVSYLSAQVIMADWDRCEFANGFRERFPKPFDLCFDKIIRMVHQWSIERAEGTPVSLIFANNEEYAARMKAVGDAYTKDPMYADVIQSITFCESRKLTCLQCADMAAHQIGAEETRFQILEDDAARLEVTQAALRITKRGTGLIYDGPGLASCMKFFGTRNRAI